MKFIICSDLPHLICVGCACVPCTWFEFAQNWLIKSANKRIKYKTATAATDDDDNVDDGTILCLPQQAKQSAICNDNSFQLTNIIKKHLIYFMNECNLEPEETRAAAQHECGCVCEQEEV